MRPVRPLVHMIVGLATLAIVSTSPGQSQRTNSVGKIMPPDAAPLSRQVIRVMNMEPRGLDSGIHPYDDEGLVLRPFEMLMWRDEFRRPIPGAAAGYERSEDGLTWMFYLRPGARWSDGRPVTAHDFVYTFALLYIISFPDTFPAPRWAVEKYGRKWTEQGNIVTNSGFKMAEWVPGSHLKYVPDPM